MAASSFDGAAVRYSLIDERHRSLIQGGNSAVDVVDRPIGELDLVAASSRCKTADVANRHRPVDGQRWRISFNNDRAAIAHSVDHRQRAADDVDRTVRHSIRVRS